MGQIRAASIAAIAWLLLLVSPALAAEITDASESLRTGWYPEASTITPQLVSGGTFGQLWSAPVEGQVYAQPLLAEGTLLVATETDKAYGLDPTTGALKWSRSLGTAFNASDIGCGDLTPKIGVTSTPVVDSKTGIAYMTHKAYLSGESGPSRWYMDAINVKTGTEQPGFPVELSGTAQNEPAQTFQPTTELQRPGLLLLEGVVYAGFGADCDINPYQGWVFGVSTSGTVKARWTAEDDGSGSGIWQSGAGLASDGPHSILLATGNGDDPTGPIPGNTPPRDLGESIVHLEVQPDGSLTPVDFFAPYDARELDSWDADFASGGVTGLPDAYFGTSAIPNLAVAVGKDGYVYLLNRSNLGGIGEGPGGSDKVVQRIGPYGGVWSRPGVWPGEGGWVYIPTASAGTSGSGSSGNLRVYSYGLSGSGAPTLSLQGTSSDAFGFSSSAPVITSEGTTPGTALVWVVWAPNGTGEGAQLRAYDPIPQHGQPVLRWSAPVGTSTKFATPGVGAGRLYVGTRNGHVLAFGSPVEPVLSGPATDFPTTTDGATAEKTVTLTATEPLTVTHLSSSSTQFVLGEPSPALPAKLTTGQKIEVPVTFSPTGTGPLASTLTATTEGGRTASFSLSGTGQDAGAQLEANPPVVELGGTSVGASPLSGTATFRNVGGSPLTITGVKAPSAPMQASGLPAINSQLAPGQGVNITVEFIPSEIGSFSSQLELETTGGDQTVAITASAGAPGQLQIEHEAVEYGPVALGASVVKTFTVANTGGTTITIEKSKPPTGGEFSATSALAEGTSIAPGEKLTESVAFAPDALGPAAGGVWLINGEGSTFVHEVDFTGSGGAAPGVETGGSSAVGQTLATVSALVDPSGAAVTDCHFDYGTTSAYGSSAPCASGPGSGYEAEPVTAMLSGLVAATTYRYRVVSSNALGTGNGDAGTLTTSAAPALVQSSPGSLGTLGVQQAKAGGPNATLASTSLRAGVSGALTLRVRCPATVSRCAGTIALHMLVSVTTRSGQRRRVSLALAGATFAAAGGKSASVTLHLTARARALLRRERVLRVHATISARAPGGAVHVADQLVTIRARRHR